MYTLMTVTRNSYSIVNLILSMEEMYNRCPTKNSALDRWIIVDNNSSPEFLDLLESYLKSIELFKDKVFILKLNKNYLYTKANNFGYTWLVDKGYINSIIKFNHGERIILLNPDIEILNEKQIDSKMYGIMEPSLFKNADFFALLCTENYSMIDAEEGMPHIIGPVLFFHDQSVECAGGKDNGHMYYKQNIYNLYEDLNVYPRKSLSIWPSSWTTGALMSFTKNLPFAIGLLDESLSHWVSDQEFCRRCFLAENLETYASIKWKINEQNLNGPLLNPLVQTTFNKSVPFIHSQGGSSEGKPHELVFEDLPDGLEPNVVPLQLEDIKQKADQNYYIISNNLNDSKYFDNLIKNYIKKNSYMLEQAIAI